LSGGVLYGRRLAPLDPNRDAENELYGSDRVDEQAFTQRVYKHCTFANVSFLKAILDNCRFLDCAFLDCYFRKTEIPSSVFVGCKFEDCTFTELELVDCTFEFPLFRRCFIAYDEFHHQLPVDPGMRYRIADELAREANAAGASSDAREYRLQAAYAWEDHLKNIALGSGSDYYRRHFELKQRIRAARSWAWRKVNRVLWGYGERGWVLVRSFLAVGGIVFPAAFWLFVRSGLDRAAPGIPPADAKPLRLVDYELFSFDNLLNRAGFSEITFNGLGARTFVGLEVMVGLLFIGLFISLIFNWMRRR
jgi:hypothetical protein